MPERDATSVDGRFVTCGRSRPWPGTGRSPGPPRKLLIMQPALSRTLAQLVGNLGTRKVS